MSALYPEIIENREDNLFSGIAEFDMLIVQFVPLLKRIIKKAKN